MAGLKQIMEIFKAINQPLSSEQRVRWYITKRKRLCHFTSQPAVRTVLKSEGGAKIASLKQRIKFFSFCLSPILWVQVNCQMITI